MRQLIALLTMLCASLALAGEANAEWAATWTASAHGPYPVGNPTAQPELKFAFPAPEQGARDQAFRLIVKPDAWGPQTSGTTTAARLCALRQVELGRGKGSS